MIVNWWGKLARIRQVIRDYHYALDTREHGGVAAGRALDQIQAILGMQWIMGKEKSWRQQRGKSRGSSNP